MDDILEIAHRLAKWNKDILPSSSWLLENGFEILELALQRFPDHFGHLSQENNPKNITEALLLAKKLFYQNGEKMPDEIWMRTHGYYRLVNIMKENAEEFLEIVIEPNEDENKFIVLAETIEEKYGFLPSKNWLRTNGYEELSRYITRHRNIFESFYDRFREKTTEELKRMLRNKKEMPHSLQVKIKAYIKIGRVAIAIR